MSEYINLPALPKLKHPDNRIANTLCPEHKAQYMKWAFHPGFLGENYSNTHQIEQTGEHIGNVIDRSNRARAELKAAQCEIIVNICRERSIE